MYNQRFGGSRMLSHFRIPGAGSCLLLAGFLGSRKCFSPELALGAFQGFPLHSSAGFPFCLHPPIPGILSNRKSPWCSRWKPTTISWPGKSHGQRSLEGYGSWGLKYSDTTEHVTGNKQQNSLKLTLEPGHLQLQCKT